MNLALRVVLVLAVVGLQTSFFGHVRPLGIMPNLALILVILSGLSSTATTTLITAISAGWFLDIASGSDFGLRMGFYAMAAIATIAVGRLGLHAESVWTAIGLVAAGTVIFNLAIITSVPIAAGDVGVVTLRIGAELLVNLVIAAAVYISLRLASLRGAKQTDQKRVWQ